MQGTAQRSLTKSPLHRFTPELDGGALRSYPKLPVQAESQSLLVKAPADDYSSDIASFSPTAISLSSNTSRASSSSPSTNV